MSKHTRLRFLAWSRVAARAGMVSAVCSNNSPNVVCPNLLPAFDRINKGTGEERRNREEGRGERRGHTYVHLLDDGHERAELIIDELVPSSSSSSDSISVLQKMLRRRWRRWRRWSSCRYENEREWKGEWRDAKGRETKFTAWNSSSAF